VTQLAHCARFDLSNSLASQVECFANFFESARLATVETETQRQNFALALIERRKKTSDFFWQQSSCGNLERRLSRAVFDNITEFSIAVFTQWL
jgi:hypothetical protein